MEKYKEIKTIKIINEETGEETTTETEKKYIIKTWNELTTEEKEKEIERNQESIYMHYQDDLYYQFKEEIEDIKERYNNITFDDVFLDGCSQGSWIDKVKNFKCYYNINILGETLETSDIYLHIRKYIEEITENDIEIYNYYIEDEKLQKIQNTKKYQKFINDIIKEVNNWIDDINRTCKEIIKNEYNYPCNLNDPEDASYLENYFDGIEFTFEI